jgi:excisionase family DNA binding protein
MDVTFYTVEQVARLLELHPKTVQRYIREGRLRASKPGKRWRISGHDLSLFVEGGREETAAPDTVVQKDSNVLLEQARVSAVFDLPTDSRESSMRLVNLLNAALAGKPEAYGPVSMSTQFIEPGHIVRILLWGGLDLMETMTSMISACLRNRDMEE